MSEQKLPHWDLESVYSSLDGEDYRRDRVEIERLITGLQGRFAAEKIERRDDVVTDGETIALFEELLGAYNEIGMLSLVLHPYLFALTAVNTRDEAAQAALNSLDQLMAKFSLMGTQFVGWLGCLDHDELKTGSALAQAHEHLLRQAQVQSEHLLGGETERLLSTLRLTGSGAWSKMGMNYMSQIEATVWLDGEEVERPLSIANSLMSHEEREVRRRAYEGHVAALAANELPLAEALNAIKGEVNTISKARRWESPLAGVLFENVIDKATLEAMLAAAKRSFPDFQRYADIRAEALGIPYMAWYDRLAPLAKGGQSWAYEEGIAFVAEQFATYSPRMANLAERAWKESWIDAEPRSGKRDGAFCLPMGRSDSRIMANYKSNFSSVGTLAHELGHAYHNLNLAERSYWQRQVPMTLAETASTFCQKIVEQAALKVAGPEDKILILDGSLEYAARVIQLSTANFLFEDWFFEDREKRPLSAKEICVLALKSQKAVLGEYPEADRYHPYRWAYVPHFYVRSYYNFQYTFGLLFGLGLYAQYEADADKFRGGYDELLSLAGMGMATTLAERFGIDIRQESFWEASLDVLRGEIEGLAAALSVEGEGD
ncbi:MAG TPA: M3 family metallopeptidase [Anaerolineae bacterium]|nr:M3 family metallopeptidase [Anaerolineae bacterium]